MHRYCQIFLADRTNGLAYTTVLRPTLRRLSSVRNVLWLNGASERKLLLSAVVCDQSTGTKMNNLDLCLEVT